jgi:bacteriocin biosynthesis cyclodehydratase domain-containing protein
MRTVAASRAAVVAAATEAVQPTTYSAAQVTEPTAVLRAVPERPALAPWLRVLQGEERLLLEHGGTVISFDGKAAGLLLPSLLPLLDGSHTVRDIVETLGAAVAPATRNALELLNERGALLEGPQPSAGGGPTSDAAVFVAALGWAPPPEALARLSSSRVVVSGNSSVALELLRALTATGLRSVKAVDVDDRSVEAELMIAAPAADELQVLRSLNERRLEAKAPWLQVLPNDGRIVAIGPLFVPGVSACHVCYRIRRGAGSGFEDDFELVDGTEPKAGSPSPISTVAAGIAGILALRWLAGRDPTLPGRFYSLETGVVLGLRNHLVLRVPRCPACGVGDAAMPSPWFNVKAPDA